MQSVGRVAEGFLSQRDRRGLTQNSSKYKFNEKDFVTPSKDSVSYHAQQTLLEYGIECYVIRDDAWNRKSLGTTSNGIVYLKETIPQEHLKRIAPHESVHVMKQIGYEPYIDFLNRCSSLFNFSTEEARYLLNNSASHCKVDIFSANDTDINRVYDEFNATLFGHIAANLLDERTDWMRSAFYDFDAYVKELSDIHERFKRDMKARRSESTNQINDVVDLDVQQAKSDQASSSEWSAERIKDGKVLQKDGGSGTIKENVQGDVNSEQKYSKHAEEKLSSDRRAESRTFESTSGTRTENEDRSRIQSEDGEVSEDTGGTFTSNRGINGINDNDDIPFDSSDIVKVDKNNILYELQQKIINEYDVECYIIKDSAWKTKGSEAPAGAYKGRVYMSESFSGNLLATLVPHEITHIMKQLKYQPYLDFMDKVPDMLDRSSADINILIDWIAEHCGFDFFSMSISEAMHFYDEMNAAIYGFYKSGMLESEGLADHVPNAFYDFNAYISELDAIHEQFKRDMKAQQIETSNQIDDSTTPDVQQAKSDQASSSEWSAERIKDGKAEKAKPISEIIEQIRHDFGIHITKGHVRGKGVLGQYSRKNHGIRTKIANDLPTVAHELGHALDQRYGLTDKSKLTKEMRSELINALGGLKDSYKQNLWVSEGFAEYIRRFLQNRDDAARSYPEFTKHFLNSLSKTDRLLIDTFADEINAYYALDADTATSSIRLREEGTPDARTALEKAREMGDDIYQAWVDANHGIRLFDEATGGDAYKLASNAAYSDAIAGQIITGDFTDANGQYVAPGLKSALEGVNIGDKRIYREFGEYLVLKHGPERLNEGMMIFADPRKNNASFMDKRVAEIENSHPEFKEAADKLYEFQKQFLKTWAVDTGLLPAEVAEAWAKRWSFYVPLNRAVGKTGTIGAKRGYANQNSTVKKAIGSGLDIVHPVDNIISNIVKMVNAGVRNNVMLEITSQAESLGADAMFLEKVPTPMKKKAADLTGVKAKLHDAFGAAGIGELLAEVEGESGAERTLLHHNDDNVSKRLSTNDLKDYLNAGSRQNNSKMRALNDGKKLILTSENEITDFIDDSIQGEQGLITVAYGKVAERLSRDVDEYSKGKINIANYYLELVPNDLSHAYKEHVNAKQDGDIDLSLDDFHNIPDYLDNYDDLVYAIQYASGTTRICVSKKKDNGRVILIETVSKSRGSIEFKNIIGVSEDKYNSEYSNKYKKGNKTNTGGSESSNISPRDEFVSNNSISHKNENVNKKISTNSSDGKNGAKSEAWSQIDEIIESTIDDVLVQYGQGKAHGDVVTVLRNGKQEFWKINDALLLESLTSMSQKKMNGVMEAYAVVSRFMTFNRSIYRVFEHNVMLLFLFCLLLKPHFAVFGEGMDKIALGKASSKHCLGIGVFDQLGNGSAQGARAVFGGKVVRNDRFDDAIVKLNKHSCAFDAICDRQKQQGSDGFQILAAERFEANDLVHSVEKFGAEVPFQGIVNPLSRPFLVFCLI